MDSDPGLRPIEFELDEHGRLIRPGCHDAALAKFAYENSKGMDLLAVRSDSSKVWLHIENIIDAQVTLWAGVIISEIFIWKVAELPSAL